MFWEDLTRKINVKLPITKQFVANNINIIFGSLETTGIVNLIVLSAKQFIVNRKFKEEVINVDIFLAFLDKTFQMEKLLAQKDNKINKFKERWSPFIDGSCNLKV